MQIESNNVEKQSIEELRLVQNCGWI
jgi:hypothetical protein